MATLPVAGYLTNATRTEGEAKVALDDLIASIKQIPGAGVAETTLTIASGSITPPSGGPGIFMVDTEAAAATDDLTNIVQTNIPDGSLIFIRQANAGRVVTVKTSAGGAGQIVLGAGLDLVGGIKKFLCLKRTGTLWEDVTGGGLLSPVIQTGVVSADPTVAMGIASKQYADQHGFTTGDVKLTLKAVADTTWVLMDDKTIGNASSGASGRANADTADLFTLLWTNITNTWAPVSGGRGASAAADFSANKTIALPKTLGRAMAGYGTGTVVGAGVDTDVDLTANDLAVPSNTAKWITGMPVVFVLTSGTITGLTSSTTYYVIRSSATRIQLASTLANAQNGTAIDFTAKSSPIWTITHTYTARVLGEAVGEQTHALSSTEQLAHTHPTGSGSTLGTAGSGGSEGYATSAANITRSSVSASTGGNVAANIMQPTIFLNVMVKL